jgi:hypothetical protein
VFRRATPKNIQNRSGTSGYDKRMRIKGKHLFERIQTKGRQARKSRRRASTKTSFLLIFLARERHLAGTRRLVARF